MNLRTIASIPRRLGEAVSIESRGEVFMPKLEFARINAEREEAGLPTYANPRNSGAGSLRQIDPSVTASRNLATWQYQLIEAEGPATSQSEALARLEALGLPVNPNREAGLDIDGVLAFIERWRERRHELAVRDRRRGRQGRPLRPAGAPGHGGARPALGDRVQVPAGAGRDLPRGHRPVRRAGPGR